MKKVFLILSACGALAVLVVAVVAVRFIPSASARRSWKDDAIAQISSRVTGSWPSNEVARLKTKGTNDPDNSESWVTDRIILMRNGDWLAYTNICNKENRRIQDLFLGLGSDGRWYYSTYHFCIGMCVLKMEEQPDDLAAFAKEYYVRSFDGHSDECLQKTWPPDVPK